MKQTIEGIRIFGTIDLPIQASPQEEERAGNIKKENKQK